ncbi:MAG: glycosyltransferase family 39 protein [Terracidiphilus sp.]
MNSSPWSRKKIVALAAGVVLLHAVLLFAVFPRLAAHLGTAYNQDRFTDGYDSIAANLAAGNGYRFYPDTAKTLMREPGYPVLLAGLRLAVGDSIFAVQILNMLFALGTAALIVLLARRFTRNPWVILAAALLFLFHPGTLVAEGRGGVEILFGFLTVLFFLTLVRAVQSARLAGFLLCGLVLGLTVLVRSVLMPFPVFLLAYLLLMERQTMPARFALRNVAVMILAMFAVLSPWIVRNYSLTGRFIPTASVLGVSAHAGHYITSHLSEGKPWWLLDREAGRQRDQLATDLGYRFDGGYYQVFFRTEDELSFSSFLVHRVVTDYRDAPGAFIQMLFRNVFNFWFTGKTPTATRLNLAVQLPYLLLATAGVVVGFRRQKRFVVLMLLLIGYTMAVYLPILAQARYSIPLVPFLSLLGAMALVPVHGAIVHRNARAAAQSDPAPASARAEISRKETELLCPPR